MAGHDLPLPTSRLERALRDLEKVVKDSEHPLRRLRDAIEYQKTLGKFDERFLVAEIKRLQTRAEFSAQDIDNLAARLRLEVP